MNLAKEITYLLFKHQCVILPDFGGFLVNPKPATYFIQNHSLQPIHTHLAFNSHLKNNDGLLANRLVQSQHIDYQDSLTFISNYVAYLKNTLETKRNVEVEGVGTFYLSKEEKLIFVPYLNTNFNIDSYGLNTLKLKPIAKSPIIETHPVLNPGNVPRIQLTEKEQLKERREKLKERHRQEKQFQNIPLKSRSFVSIANVLGGFFLVAVIAATVNFDQGLKSEATILNPANSLSALSAEMDEVSVENTITTQKNRINAMLDEYNKRLEVVSYHIIVANDYETEEVANKILVQYNNQYPSSAILTNVSGKINVSLYAFSNEQLAKEFLLLIQPKTKDKLAIAKK